MVNATKYLGMSKKGAQNQAESDNIVFRLISIDGDAYMSWPDEKRDDRVCVVIEKGKVVKADIH